MGVLLKKVWFERGSTSKTFEDWGHPYFFQTLKVQPILPCPLHKNEQSLCLPTPVKHIKITDPVQKIVTKHFFKKYLRLRSKNVFN